MSDRDHLTDTSNRQMPLVSIVIPTFNRRHLLSDAVESCRNQSYKNIEVIIVDDGSTDETGAFIAAQIAGPWSNRVRYFRQKNAGASAARNQGLVLASGKYVQFLDSDDILFRDKISTQVRALEMATSKQELCSCFGRLGPMTQDLSITQRIGIQCTKPAEYMRQMSSKVIHGMPTMAPLWNREFLISRPSWRPDISLGDDLEYYLRLLAETNNVGFVAQDLFFVREHDGPHLSDAGNNRDRIISAFRTHQSVVKTMRNSGLWDVDVQTGIFRKARTLYANILQCGTKPDILEFETWIRSLQKEGKSDLILTILLFFRRYFGRDLILHAHRLHLRIKTIGRPEIISISN